MAELDAENTNYEGHFMAVVMIELARIYDMLAVIARGLGKEDEVNALYALHEKGKFFAPPPALVVNEDNN